MDAAPRNERAEDRTDLAEDRTVLANERTFAGWLRTGFASVGVGIGFNVLFQTLQPPWLPKAIATAFLLVGIYIIVVAERRACAVMRRFDARKVAAMQPMNLRVVTIVTVAATVGLIAGIWALT